jgi:peptide/nickel transport system ATP-binding protein
MTALNPAYTIGDQLMEVHRRHRRSSAAQARDRAVELLGKVGMSSAAQRLGQYPHQLSGGLRQRVMIAMALMCDPELLIADEPSTALDVTIQAQILRLLADLQRELGIAMILITHDLGVVARIAQRVAVMYAGEIVEEADVADLFDMPHHPYTQGLLDCIPVPGRNEPGSRLGTIAGTVPSLLGSFEGCGFRERCAYAQEACRANVPLRTVSGHGWRCVLDTLPAKAVKEVPA